MFDILFKEIFADREHVEITESGDDFLKAACRLYDLDNLAYLGVNLPVSNVQNYYVHNTYSGDWAMRYESQNYVSIDPIVRRGMTSLLPVEWKGLERLGRPELKFFGEAKEFGVGHQGMTFPVRGIHGETAIFSVSSSMNDRDWIEFRRNKMKDMRIIAEFFHQRVLNAVTNQTARAQNPLTHRELECLHWSAEGKTYEDIAVILSIAPRTVRFFLENARHKLGSLNTTHAVVSAMSRGLI